MSLLRLTFFFIAFILAAAGPWFVFIPVLLGYVLFYGGVEILLIALVADTYFLTLPAAYPYFTLGTGAVLLLVHWLRPRLALYNK